MEMVLTYVIVFAVGGIICVIGQILLNLTKMTPARILVLFLLAGVLLEAVGLFKYIKDFAQAGVTIPICGFGSVLVKGAVEGAQESGILGAFLGSVTAASAGLTAAIVFGFLFSIIFSSKNKS